MTDAERIAELESKLEAAEEENARLEQDLIEAQARRIVEDAREYMSDVACRYAYDATGQDGEYEMDQAAEAYIDAQNEALRMTDPDSWSEQRAMGLL